MEVLAPIAARPTPDDLSEPDRAAAALATAAPIVAKRDPSAARTMLLACWADHPVAAESEGCLDALRRLPGEAGRPPDPEQALRRAEGLLEANRNRAAIALLEPLVPGFGAPSAEGPLACRARSALGRAFRKERQHVRAIELLRPVVAACPDPGLRLRSLFVLAASTSISGDHEEGSRLYRLLAQEHPASNLADDALLFAGDLLERLGRPEEALQLYDAAAGLGTGADKRAEALFRRGWAAWRAKDHAQAEARFRAIEEEYRDRDPYEHARAAYWRARVAAGRGGDGEAAAAAVWEELTRRYPVDWYGLLSRARLAKARGAPVDALPTPLANGAGVAPVLDLGPLREHPHVRAALRLLRMGLGDEAAEELRALDLGEAGTGTVAGAGAGPGTGTGTGRAAAPAASGAGPAFTVAALLDLAGDHRSAHAILKSQGRAVLRAPPEGEAVGLWRIAYPPAFREEVERWSAPVRVPPDLLQALMREESALDPAVISQAGAVGLTQLMPSTAKSVAKRLGIGPISPSSLTDPATNIRIGAAYLGELLARYGRQPALALAAYNAGSGAVRRWLEARGSLELDEFVEEIPIDETRGYVKRVLRTFAAYRLLSGSPHPEPLDLLPRALRG
jgi:soluble lytic murein transglycosylase